MEPAIHYVPLDQVLLEPESLRPHCGSWDGGNDWSTRRGAATCRRCLKLLADEDRAQAPASRELGRAEARRAP